MELKKTIKSNKELYGNSIPPPLDLYPVQWRIDFFEGKVEETMDDENYDCDTLNMYYKAREFWKEIKTKHCAEK